MGLRHRSIRLRIFLLVLIPILSLTGLYVFAVSITAHDALVLERSRTVKNTTGLPTGELQGQIGGERLLAVIYLASPTPQNLAALHAQERNTDTALSAVRAAVTSAATVSSASPQEKQAVSVLLKDAAGLGTLRGQVTSRAISRPQAVNAYSNIFAAADLVLNQLILEETNVPLAAQGLALVSIGRSQEMLLQEDALLTGDIEARSFSAADRQEFTQLVGARRALYAQTLPELDPIYRSYYARDVSPQALAALTRLENAVTAERDPHGTPPVSPASWAGTVGAVTTGLTQAGRQAADELTLRAQPVAHATDLRLILAGGLGLLAILVSILFSVLIGRGLIRPLAALRQTALDLANDRLPDVIERLRAGEDVDVSAEVPPLESSSDEIGQVRQAFNAVQRTAIEAAVDEARLRRGISDVFRNLARRSQSLLHRQLALIDGMERRASGPEELEDLFRIDHLTTRMRRHAEGLIILSGESPGRGWRHPVPLVDVLRAAVAEVEDYTRIRVVSKTQAALAGSAVADVIHLIAELAENATIYSPPNTPVRILGDIVGRGFAVEIEDRGLGISSGKLTDINANLSSPPQFDLSGSDRLGLFIAGQLARRHDIKVTLRPSPYGGTTAIVLIPGELVVDGDAGGPLQLAGAGAGQQLAGAKTAQQLAGTAAGQQPAETETETGQQLAGAGAGQQLAGAGAGQQLAGARTAQQPAWFAATEAGQQLAGTEAGQPAGTEAGQQPAGTEAGRQLAMAPQQAAGTDSEREFRLTGRHAALSRADTFDPLRLPDPPEPASAGQLPGADGTAAARLAAGPPAGYAAADGPPIPAGSGTNTPGPAAPGLPTRIRQASLAPQLRSSSGPSSAGNGGTGPAAPTMPFPGVPVPAEPAAPPPPAPPAAASPPPAVLPPAVPPPAVPPPAVPPPAVPPPAVAGAPAAGQAVPGLPTRIRQASLAPQLRGSSAPSPSGNGTGPAAPTVPVPAPAAPSPEAARSTMAALQRGWERGRSASGTLPPEIPPAAAPDTDTEPEPDAEPAASERGSDRTDE